MQVENHRKSLLNQEDNILTAAQLEAMCAYLQSKDANIIKVLHQSHGTKVNVPPGWIHMVYNHKLSVKVAWDLYKPENFHLYFKAQQMAGNLYFGEGNADDYMTPGESVFCSAQHHTFVSLLLLIAFCLYGQCSLFAYLPNLMPSHLGLLSVHLVCSVSLLATPIHIYLIK